MALAHEDVNRAMPFARKEFEISKLRFEMESHYFLPHFSQ
jgi:hypothetical protein